ncbi:MAG: hypothetical protein IME93_04120 [Proteobacteria bacterium]|nr:hypothetical protein [Pseudomonadota bacterium]
MDSNSTGIGHGWAWVTHAWQLFTREPGLLIAMFLTIIGIQIFLSLIPILGQLASMLLSPALSGGVLYCAQKLDRGEKIGFGNMFQAFQQEGKIGPMLMLGFVSLLLGVAAMVPMFVSMAGVMEMANNPDLQQNPMAAVAGATGALFVMTVVIAVMIMLMFYATPLVMLRGVTIGVALKASFIACLRNILPLTWYSIIITVLAFIAIIPMGLGLLVLAPVMMLSQYSSYKDVFEGVQA